MPVRENCKIVITQRDNNYNLGIKNNLSMSQPISNDNRICEQHGFYKKGEACRVKKDDCDLFKWLVASHNLNDNVISHSTTDSNWSVLRGKEVFTKADDYCYTTFSTRKGDYNEFKIFYRVLERIFEEWKNKKIYIF